MSIIRNTIKSIEFTENYIINNYLYKGFIIKFYEKDNYIKIMLSSKQICNEVFNIYSKQNILNYINKKVIDIKILYDVNINNIDYINYNNIVKNNIYIKEVKEIIYDYLLDILIFDDKDRFNINYLNTTYVIINVEDYAPLIINICNYHDGNCIHYNNIEYKIYIKKNIINYYHNKKI